MEAFDIVLDKEWNEKSNSHSSILKIKNLTEEDLKMTSVLITVKDINDGVVKENLLSIHPIIIPASQAVQYDLTKELTKIKNEDADAKRFVIVVDYNTQLNAVSIHYNL